MSADNRTAGPARAWHLRVDDIESELGSDQTHPRFSWRLPSGTRAATGYHITVHEAQSENPVWDSGAVDGEQTHLIRYAGEDLHPFTRYLWRVRWADETGAWSAWSHTAWWETGLFSQDDWAGATWISGENQPAPLDGDPDPVAVPEPLLRTQFHLVGPVAHARLYVAGLGYGISWLNGRRVGNHVLDPAPTRFDRTVLYNTFDVTDTLHTGANMLGIELGRGRLGEPRPNVWNWHTASWWDHPKAIALLRITLEDGTVRDVVTDTSWECSSGAVLRDSLFGGEWFDDRADPGHWHSSSTAAPRVSSNAPQPWKPVRIATPPGGRLRAQRQPPIAVTDTIAPVSISYPRQRTRVVDFGRQLAGWARLKLELNVGQRIDVTYGERLGHGGFVNTDQKFIDPPIQRDVIVGAGRRTCYEPRFSYKGFRYLQLDGALENQAVTVSGVIAHTNVADHGTARFSDPLLNTIHDACKRSVLDNLHGVPTDTPTYEKNGWTGDAHLSLGTSLLNFDMVRVYTTWLQDFADAQTDSGELPPIVPAASWGYTASPRPIAPVPSWDVAYAEICWALYWYTGDEQPMREHYPNLVRYLRHLIARYPTLIVTWGLGDWKPPDVDGHMPEGAGVYETIYLKRWATLLTRIARVLGHEGDAEEFERLAGRVDRTFVETFLGETGDAFYGDRPTGYRQSINVLALAHGLVTPEIEPAILARLVTEIRARDNHLDTGVFGTKYLFPTLARRGHRDLAYDVLTAHGYPSYRELFVSGETNLHETWATSTRSYNHHFFSSVDQWLYEGILGVRPTAPGYRSFVIDGTLLPRLDWAQGSIETPHGTIHTRWQRTTDGGTIQLTVPPGTKATVRLPTKRATTRHVLKPGEHALTVSPQRTVVRAL